MKAVFTRCNTTFKVKSIKSFSSPNCRLHSSLSFWTAFQFKLSLVLLFFFLFFFFLRGGGALLNQIYIPNIHHCILWTGNFVVKISLEFWHEKFYPERKIVQDDHVI